MLKKLCFALLLLTVSSNCFAFDTGKMTYAITVGNEKSDYELMSFFTLPRKKVIISVSKAGKKMAFTVNGKPDFQLELAWTTKDKPGIETLVIQPKGEKPSTVQLFVMHPMSMVKNKQLNGYSIGSYPKDVYRGLPAYRTPVGLVEVTPQNEDMLISPHYRLKQFLCKQKQGYPKYVVLQTRLLQKLELLTAGVNETGIEMDSFTIMSGYRTPFYNAKLGNKKYSRHQWGGAADIFIDVHPKDGNMDDLNGDGKINRQDAVFLGKMIDDFYQNSSEYKAFIGGLGLYRANASHGPFVHVDVRGFHVRW